MKLRSGIDYALEDQATALLAKDRRDRGLKTFAEMREWLNETQIKDRQNHEVYNWTGHPETHIKQGIFKRAYNPLAGTRPRGLKPHDEV